MKILILAGGEGARLWPISRRAKPKQIRAFFNDQTLLEQTLSRIRCGFPNQDIYISTIAKFYPSIRRQTLGIPKANYLLEPVLRDRGPAIGLAATIIHKRHPGQILATAWADNFIPEVPSYLKALKNAEKIVKKHPKFTVMLGVRPRYPATNLGYIQKGKLLGKVAGYKYYISEKFVEKPNQELAKKLIQEGYVWNPGIFVWNTAHLLSLYQLYCPKNSRLLQKIGRVANRSGLNKTVAKIYPKLQAGEIENAILEKTQTKIVIPTNLFWADIGTYKDLKEALSKPGVNLTSGLVKNWRCEDSLIYEANSGKLAVGINLKNLVIVDTKDVLLVSDKDAAGDLKIFLKQIQKNKKLVKFL